MPTSFDTSTEFPIARQAIYLNHAASSPLPAVSAAVLRRYVDDREQLYHLYQAGTQDFDPTNLKSKLGRLLNAPSGSIGFVPTTTDGVSGVLNGLAWDRGDNVVLPANEFPGVVYACLNLGRLGVDVRLVPMTGRVLVDTLLEHTDRRTRAVVVSHVHWQTGDRVDIEALGRDCQTRGILSIVDAIQSMGALPIDVVQEPVDILVAGTYKWLLGIQGLAVLYVSDRALDRITPDRAGWLSTVTSVHSEPELVWAPGAQRFSVGGAADPAMMVLEASVEFLLDTGVDRVARHTHMVLDQLLAGVRPLGGRVNSDLGARSSFLSLTTGSNSQDAALVRALAADRIIVAQRGPGIRVAPHLHTSPEQIDRAIDAVRAFCQ